MSNEELIVHELPIFRHPNTYIVIQFIRDELFCYFRTINRKSFEKKGVLKEEKKIGLLHVTGFISIRPICYSKALDYPIDFDNEYYSYYYELKNSQWLQDTLNSINERQLKYQISHGRFYKHFIFENCKYWVEVIGTDIEFSKVKADKHLKNLWKTV